MATKPIRGATPVIINGMVNASTPTYLPSPGQVGTPYGIGKRDARTGRYDRGMIKVFASATDDGVRIRVRSGHTNMGDKVTLTLQSRIRDNGEEKIIGLGVLSKGVVINPNSYEAEHVYEVKYADVAAYFKGINGNIQFGPGAELAVLAVWPGGHEWGGFSRGGSFTAPVPLKPTAMTNARTASAPSKGPVPLDIGVKYSKALTAKYPVLISNGQFSSRLEQETKLDVELAKLDGVRQKLNQLAKDPVSVRRVIGSGWSLTPVDKYFKHDKAGKILKDASGKPVLDPMTDTYYDSKDLKLAKAQVALRFRSKEGDTKNLVNIKPGPGITDSKGITSRIEYGLHVAKGTKDHPEKMAPFFGSGEHLNPFRFIGLRVPSALLNPKDVLRPAMRLVDFRYKFDLVHKDGTAIELSLDHVFATSLDHKDPKGKPLTAEYGQFEMDLGHIQLASTNVVNGKQTPVVLNSIKAFGNEAVQKDWLSKVSDKASMGGPPRIHVPGDVKNAALKKNGAFKQHELATERLEKHLFGRGGVRPASQKYYVAAKKMRLIK